MKKYYSALLFSLGLSSVLTGCTNEPTEPPCENLKKDISPSVRAELEKRCPRSGPDFQPSPKKEY